MAVEKKLYYVNILANLLLYSSLFLIARTQNFGSTANLPNKWINKPLNLVSDTNSTLTPILVRETDGPSFVCGFYCRYNSDGCLFGVLINQNKVDDPENISKLLLQSPELVWSANRHESVKTDATLQFRQDGDLVVEDSNGTMVWSSNTGGKSVSGLNLTEEGNLVLFGRNNITIWQSFDYPTDTLLLGQKLVPGQKLKANFSVTNWSQGILFLSVESDGLSGYADYNPHQRYYHSPLIDHSYAEFSNGSFNGLSIPPASSPQFMRFEYDGLLKVYQWEEEKWSQVSDLLKFVTGDCGRPLVCNTYGLCSSTVQCSCPFSQEDGYLRQRNFREPALGCDLVTQITCDHSQNHSLLELKNTYYFENDTNLFKKEVSMEECKKMCLKNCTCKGAFFTTSTGISGNCLLLNDVLSIINNEMPPNQSRMFIKVQNSSGTGQNSSGTGSRRKEVMLASIFGTFFGVLIAIGSCLVIFRRRLKRSDEIEREFLEQVPGMPTRYSYVNLKVATRDFSKKLGEGGFGSVYEGSLSDGTKVAVKLPDGLAQVKDSFLVEVKTIASIHHVNLVKLVGFCFEKSHRLLVYEYMANGSLDRWIFGGNQNIPLPWQTRKKIISEIAKGLAYLHEECSQKIIHFDIKPQNILLDENFNAKVSDFGLSKLIEKDQSRVFTAMRGTPGYLAPEWLRSEITEKVDVYGFGIVMLEIICGRKNLDWSRSETDKHLLRLFQRKAEEGTLQDLLDKESEDMQINREEAVDMLMISAWCLQGDFTMRPSMSLVVKALEGLVSVETSLDYDFTNPATVKTVAPVDPRQEVSDTASPLLPSILSGPR